MRLGTELRATRRGWPGDSAVGGDSGRFSLGSCALLSPPSGGSGHHWSQCGPIRDLAAGTGLCVGRGTWALPGSHWGVLLPPAPRTVTELT